MAKKVRLVYNGVTSIDYVIDTEGNVSTIFGNELTARDGRITLTLEGKRKRVKISDLLDESFATTKTPPVFDQAVVPEETKLKVEIDTPAVKPEEKQVKVPNNVNPVNERYFVSKTTNPSAITVSNQLEQDGVVHHNRHLILFNKDLEGVNPHNPALKREIAKAVTIELEMNPWYFLREVYRVSDPVTGKRVPALLTKEVLDTYHLLNLGHSVYYAKNQDSDEVIDAIKAYTLWTSLHDNASKTSVISDSSEKAKKIAQSIHGSIATLPRSVRPDAWKWEDVEAMANVEINSKIAIATHETPLNGTGASIIAMNMSTPIQWFDELEFITDALQVLQESHIRHEIACKKAIGSYPRIVTSQVNINEVATFNEFLENTIATIGREVLDLSLTELDQLVEQSNGFFYIQNPEVAEDIREVQEFVSKHQWYTEESDVETVNLAVSLYESLDLEFNPIPTIVLEDIIEDGRADNIKDAEMVRAYTIRRIVQTQKNILEHPNSLYYDSFEDTMFARFGVTRGDLVTAIMRKEPLIMAQYYNLLFQALKSAKELEDVQSIPDYDILTAESLYYILTLLNK